MRIIFTVLLLSALASCPRTGEAITPHNYTPIPKKQIGCVAVQVCGTCTDDRGRTYPCSCHMECLPGTH
jgi:hypothetical protein